MVSVYHETSSNFICQLPKNKIFVSPLLSNALEFHISPVCSPSRRSPSLNTRCPIKRPHTYVRILHSFSHTLAPIRVRYTLSNTTNVAAHKHTHTRRRLREERRPHVAQVSRHPQGMTSSLEPFSPSFGRQGFAFVRTHTRPPPYEEMVRGCCYCYCCCCCCCWCVQSTPVEPRAVRSIEARGYYTFLGGGHPCSPSLSLLLFASLSFSVSVLYAIPGCAPRCETSRWRATFCSIPGPTCVLRLFLPGLIARETAIRVIRSGHVYRGSSYVQPRS